MNSSINEVYSCNAIILPYGNICLRKKMNDSDFCGFHLKRELKAGHRVTGLCNHIIKEKRCGNPTSEENGLCSKHGTFIMEPPPLADWSCRCRGEHRCGIRF
jgi:hypothetical protein